MVDRLPLQMMSPPDFEVRDGELQFAGWTADHGPQVVILHGGPGLSEYTEGLLPELVEGYAVVRFQQRGLAPSTTAGPFDVETQVQDVIRVLDGLGLARPLVIGHSWGGYLLMHLLATHPDRVGAALVVDPLGAVGDGGEADLGRMLGERSTPGARARIQELDEKAARGEGTEADQLEGLSLVWPGYFAHPAAAPPMPPLAISIACHSGTFASIHRHFERNTLVTTLPHSTVPAMFVLGAESPIPPAHGIASAALLPLAEVRIEPDCGHFVWLEKAGVVRTELDRLAARAGLAS